METFKITFEIMAVLLKEYLKSREPEESLLEKAEESLLDRIDEQEEGI